MFLDHQLTKIIIYFIIMVIYQHMMVSSVPIVFQSFSHHLQQPQLFHLQPHYLHLQVNFKILLIGQNNQHYKSNQTLIFTIFFLYFVFPSFTINSCNWWKWFTFIFISKLINHSSRASWWILIGRNLIIIIIQWWSTSKCLRFKHKWQKFKSIAKFNSQLFWYSCNLYNSLKCYNCHWMFTSYPECTHICRLFLHSWFN